MDIINFLGEVAQSIVYSLTHEANIFYDIGLIIIVATFFAFFARLKKQPLIPAYVLAGILLGPIMGLITNTDTIKILSEIGIAFLLFIVGLELDIRKLKDVGPVSFIGGTIQVFTIFTVGILLGVGLGYRNLHAIYIGLIIAFSSTMVVIKLLSDKKELDTLHGRIIVGILLTQDFFAIIAISILSSLNDFSIMKLTFSLLRGVGAVGFAILCSRLIYPKLFKFAAKSQEFLFMISISICFIFSLIIHWIGFSIAIGAFVAGITLASLPYNLQIIGKVNSLKDFFSTLFFVSLGMNFVLGSILKLIGPLIVLTILVLLIKTFMIFYTCLFFNYKNRTSFLTSISLAQISEFSLIIAGLGFTLGHITNEILTLTILLALTTIILTSYLIKYDTNIYFKLRFPLQIFDQYTEHRSELEYVPDKSKHQVVILGYNRLGYSIVHKLSSMKKRILVVDYNPELIKKLIKIKVPCIYGDIGDTEILDRLNLAKTEMIISTIPDFRDNSLLLRKTREVNEKALVFVTADQIEEALNLYERGADYVILPHFLGGDHVALMLEDITQDITKIIDHKLGHIKELQRRRSLGHEHPFHSEQRV